MRAKKIVLDEAAAQLLKTLKSRTGMTHQYSCRLAFCLSLNDRSALDPGDYDERGPEFNRYTLTGEYDDLFVAYLREWLVDHDGADAHDEAEWFRAHVNRGLQTLPRRLRRLDDVAALIPA